MTTDHRPHTTVPARHIPVACLAAFVLAVFMTRSFVHADVLSHWRFDEEAGKVAMDGVGGIDGLLSGGATFAPSSGVAGGAVLLDRTTNDLVNFGDVYPFTDGVNLLLLLSLG